MINRTILLANAVTGSTNISASIPIGNAKKITLFGYGVNTGILGKAGSLSVQVLVANADVAGTWATYSKLIDNATNSNSQTLTRIAAAPIASGSTPILAIDPTDTFTHFRTTITVQAAGSYYLIAQIQE